MVDCVLVMVPVVVATAASAALELAMIPGVAAAVGLVLKAPVEASAAGVAGAALVSVMVPGVTAAAGLVLKVPVEASAAGASVADESFSCPGIRNGSRSGHCWLQ